MSENDDAFGGGLFGDFLDTVKPGTRVSGIGLMRYRAGASSRNWSSPGNAKYLPGDWHMQCGAHKKMFTQRSSGGFEITFPIPFAEPPLFIVSCGGTLPLFEEVRFQSTIQSSAVIEIYWWSTNNLTRVYVNWLAFGPIGL